ncbi:phosphatidic acid phosphatase beta [Diplocarpon rosae]|nr:phosphatidic acid phosphatase beta [Diplocarpon rosae]
MPITPASASPCRLSEITRKLDGISYLRIVWFDYVSIAAVAASALWVYSLPMYYLDHRLIPIQFSTSEDAIQDSVPEIRGPIELSYPYVKEPLPTWACAVVVVFVPMLFITMFQLKMRSIWDFHAGFTGTLKTSAASTFIATILKHFIGGFRPHFLEVCRPDSKKLFDQVWMNSSACTANTHAVNRAWGFPSGHTTSAFASSMFLSLYLNAKLKAFGDHASEFWVFVVTIIPLLLASLIAGSMYISYQHHAHEIVIGMLIGLVLGVLGYRSAYAAIFDSRYNHIPLPPFGARLRLKNVANVSTFEAQGQAAEAYQPVMWHWWMQSETTNQDRETRLSWLRSMGCLEGVEQDMNLLVRLRKQS